MKYIIFILVGFILFPILIYLCSKFGAFGYYRGKKLSEEMEQKEDFENN